MNKVNYLPNMYQHYNYGNWDPSMYHQNQTYRNHQENDQDLLNTIYFGVKREATAVDLYSRLANLAPDQTHRNEILQTLANKQFYLDQFTNLYISLTGWQPVYQIEKISFDNYRDGLNKASKFGEEAYEEYQRQGISTQNSLVQSIFLQASRGASENAARLELLNNEALKDYGPESFVVDIEKATTKNDTFRTALWTGNHLQLTLMSIDAGDDIGLEMHPDVDQFIRIEEGQGLVQMGDSEGQFNFEQKAFADYAIFVPAGKWHNLTNTGTKPLKLYSIYAPPEHPRGTVHKTKEEAFNSEENHH